MESANPSSFEGRDLLECCLRLLTMYGQPHSDRLEVIPLADVGERVSDLSRDLCDQSI